MNFKEYWQKERVPDLERMTTRQCEMLRIVANKAFNAGRTAMRREIRETEYEKKYGHIRSN